MFALQKLAQTVRSSFVPKVHQFSFIEQLSVLWKIFEGFVGLIN